MLWFWDFVNEEKHLTFGWCVQYPGGSALTSLTYDIHRWSVLEPGCHAAPAAHQWVHRDCSQPSAPDCGGQESRQGCRALHLCQWQGPQWSRAYGSLQVVSGPRAPFRYSSTASLALPSSYTPPCLFSFLSVPFQAWLLSFLLVHRNLASSVRHELCVFQHITTKLTYTVCVLLLSFLCVLMIALNN